MGHNPLINVSANFIIISVLNEYIFITQIICFVEMMSCLNCLEISAVKFGAGRVLAGQGRI